MHVCIDDASRLAYGEVLPDERKASAVAFLERAVGWFESHGVTVECVVTDNGSAYRSQHWRHACGGLALRHPSAPTGVPRFDRRRRSSVPTYHRPGPVRRGGASNAAGAGRRPAGPVTLQQEEAMRERLNNVRGNDSYFIGFTRGATMWHTGRMAQSDPAFAAKLADIVGLYVDPTKHAIVLSVDEKYVDGLRLAREIVSLWHNEVALRSCVRPVDAVFAQPLALMGSADYASRKP